MAIDVFTGKAARYAKYRWDYAPQAIQTIFEVTGISERSGTTNPSMDRRSAGGPALSPDRRDRSAA